MARRQSTLKKAEAFFYKHTGWGYTPGKETKAQGRRRGAKKLAHAEAEAASRGWRVDWEEEQDPDLSWADEEQRDGIDEVLYAVLRDENGTILDSLGNITFGKNSMENRNYRRVVEAELALEALK